MTTLDGLLAEWAAEHQLTDREFERIRANVLASAQAEIGFDADWLWALLRPVTTLLESSVTSRGRTLGRWPYSETYTPYLQLA